MSDRRISSVGGRSVLTLATLLLFFAAGCATDPIRRELGVPEGEELVLPTERHRDSFFVEAWVDGRGPFSLLLDTGASHTVLSHDLVGRTRPRPEGPGDWGSVREIRVGQLVVSNATVLAYDTEGFATAYGRDMDGILGFDAFAEHLLTIDYGKSRVSVRAGSLPPPDGLTVFELSARGRPYVDLELQGETRSFLIDSGSPAALGVIRPDKLRWKSPLVPVGASRDIDGLHIRKEGRLDGDVRFGAVTLVDPIARPDDDVSLIGTAVLEYFELTFDASNRRIEMNPLGRTKAIHFEPVIGFGVAVVRAGGALDVIETFPGTPAADRDLRPGDRIVAIEGAPVSPERRFEFEVGKEVEVEFERDGSRRSVTLVMRPLVP